MARNNAYQFEIEGRRFTHRKNTAAKAELPIFVRRLGIEDVDYADYEEKLIRYIKDCHLNILWYERRLKRERRLRNFFIVLSLALLALIPVAILILGSDWFLNQIGIDPDKAEKILPAQITAIVTSLLALQKTLRSWLDGRKFMAHFQKAATDLKAFLYEFENRSDLVKDNQLNKGFETILKAETQQVRERVEQETHQYYTKLEEGTLPGEDIAATLTTAQTNAQTLFGKFYPKVEKRKALATAEQAALQHKQEIEKYEELIEKVKEDLKKAGNDDTLKEVATTRLKGMEALRQTAIENWVKETTTRDTLKQSLESS